MNNPKGTVEFSVFILFMFFSAKDMLQFHRTTGIFVYFMAEELNSFAGLFKLFFQQSGTKPCFSVFVTERIF